MSAERLSRRRVLGLLPAACLLGATSESSALLANPDDAPAPTPEPKIPVASNFMLPMKVWRRHGWKFGAGWPWAKCPKCQKAYTHVGEDVNGGRAFARYRVYATEAGVVRLVLHSKRWAHACVIEHELRSGARATSVCWHLSKPIVRVGQVVERRQPIGVLADLGSGTHLHFGIRRAPYDRVRSCKGALPSCRCLQPDLPLFPERFTKPTAWVRAV